jgi:DNA-binding CsgD family transcriptional regulator/tetratricopeptide (TPR) repeat protein
LVDQSLVQRGEGPNGEARFTLLETVREFGLERLAASGDEEATIRDAHADHFLALAERAEPELSGANQTPWFDLLVAERPNLRAALGWLRDREDAPRLYRLAGALGLFWTWPPFLREGRAWLEATLAIPPAGVPARAIGRVLGATGTIAMWQNDVERAAAIFDRALAAWRAIDDPLEIAHALRNLGNVALHLGDVDRARDVVAESLARFRQLGEPWSVGLALATLATVDSACGDHDQAIARNDEALALFLALPGQRYSNVAQRNLAWEHLLRGDQANARRGYRQVLAHAREHDDRREVAACAEGAAGLAAAAGDQERAARLFAAAAALRAEEELALLPSTAAQLGALLDAVRVRLPAPAFAAAWRAGGRLTLAQTIAETDALLTASPLPASPAPSPMATPSPAGEAAARGLTRRQTDVLRLIVAGKTDREIAALLFITRRTASKHVSAVLAGLGVASRSAAAAAAVQRRLV